MSIYNLECITFKQRRGSSLKFERILAPRCCGLDLQQLAGGMLDTVTSSVDECDDSLLSHLDLKVVYNLMLKIFEFIFCFRVNTKINTW